MRDAIPVLQTSIEGLAKVSKSDIDELKSITHPIDTIVTLVTAVCIILRIKPIPINNESTGFKEKMDYWRSAIGHDCLGNHNVIKLLTAIDPLTLDIEVMTELETLLDEHKLDISKVKYATKAA